MTEISLSYGNETRTVNLPSELLAAPPIAPRAADGGAANPRAALVGAMRNPVGQTRLKDMVTGKRVALVVNDEFRAGLHEMILDVMFEELAEGRPSKLTVLCATGTHDPAIYASNVREWTRAASARYGLPCGFVAHDCDDPGLIYIGKTMRGNRIFLEPAWLEAEVRVFGHEGKHHYMAGYSTVAKQVLPGIAGRESVAFNHKLALDDQSRAGQHPLHADPARRANPFAEDALEAMHLAFGRALAADGSVVDRHAETFLLEVISEKGLVFWAGAGDPDEVTRMMIAKSDEQALFEVPKSRYVIVSPGGPPASSAMYGVQNCFDMALLGAIEPGGEALVLAPCDGRPGVPDDVRGLAPDAESKKLFWDNLVRLRDASLNECYREISDNFELYLWKTWRVLRLFKRDGVKIWIYSGLLGDVLNKGGFESCADVQRWIDERARRRDGKFTVIDGGNKLLVMPKQG